MYNILCNYTVTTKDRLFSDGTRKYVVSTAEVCTAFFVNAPQEEVPAEGKKQPQQKHTAVSLPLCHALCGVC